jgi:hypothetical protein
MSSNLLRTTIIPRLPQRSYQSPIVPFVFTQTYILIAGDLVEVRLPLFSSSNMQSAAMVFSPFASSIRSYT